MTLEELDALYPNGLDDAGIERLNLDYHSRSAEIHFNFRRKPPDGPNRDDYERAVLLLRGFYYFVIEPPDTDHFLYPERSIQVSGSAEDASEFPLFGHFMPRLPADAFCCRLYVHERNSFIHIAVRGAHLSWAEDRNRTKSGPSGS